MNRLRTALFAATLLPLTGCVFAVGSDDEETERLRDRVRDLEQRVDRIDPPPVIVIEGKTYKEVLPEPAPAPAPEKVPQ